MPIHWVTDITSAAALVADPKLCKRPTASDGKKTFFRGDVFLGGKVVLPGNPKLCSVPQCRCRLSKGLLLRLGLPLMFEQ